MKVDYLEMEKNETETALEKKISNNFHMNLTWYKICVVIDWIHLLFDVKIARTTAQQYKIYYKI